MQHIIHEDTKVLSGTSTVLPSPKQDSKNIVVLSTFKVSKENQLSKLKHVRGQWQDSINDEDTEAQSGVSNVLQVPNQDFRGHR